MERVPGIAQADLAPHRMLAQLLGLNITETKHLLPECARAQTTDATLPQTLPGQKLVLA